MRNEPRMYKPSFAGFVDVDLTAEKKLSLRSLVCDGFSQIFHFLSTIFLSSGRPN